jgi:predicted nuclease with RNAse H fold
VDEARVGVAVGEYRTGVVDVGIVTVCTRKRPAPVIITEWLRGWRAPALLAIDAPLGWPRLLSRSLFAHRAGEKIATAADDMFRRATDRFIKKGLGKTPLDVGADRIARTAHAALRLLDDLRERLNTPIPLAWTPASITGVAAIEVYPAATLLAHGLRSNGYKAAPQISQRRELVGQLRSKLKFPTETPILEGNADALDALVCLLAAKDFLEDRAMPPSNQLVAEQEGWIWASRASVKKKLGKDADRAR